MEVIHFQAPLTSALEREVGNMPSVWAEFAPLTSEKQGFGCQRIFQNISCICILLITPARSWWFCSWNDFPSLVICHWAPRGFWVEILQTARLFLPTLVCGWLSFKRLRVGHSHWSVSHTFIVSCPLPNPVAVENALIGIHSHLEMVL